MEKRRKAIIMIYKSFFMCIWWTPKRETQAPRPDVKDALRGITSAVGEKFSRPHYR